MVRRPWHVVAFLLRQNFVYSVMKPLHYIAAAGMSSHDITSGFAVQIGSLILEVTAQGCPSELRVLVQSPRAYGLRGDC